MHDFCFSHRQHEKKIIFYQFITEINEADIGRSADDYYRDAFYEFHQPFCRPLETALDTTLASSGPDRSL